MDQRLATHPDGLYREGREHDRLLDRVPGQALEGRRR
ncbi:hypothetical protein HNR61_009099 [Actinomadura namibiensis]|uniref:Uncharacterized protein n=1 Tax=Actinomadura namibiensis TaxID=182080 RepID=A0A7W3LZW4_ACTNM|nr:hypothetical protein [Actinomadura namibiensis]